jgi:hypothetical protein
LHKIRHNIRDLHDLPVLSGLRRSGRWNADMLTAEVDRLTGRAEGVEALLAKTLAERAG